MDNKKSSVKGNIVLIGMMGSGKSTLGKLLAKKLSYQFLDTDSIISQSYGLSVSSIIKEKGEYFFRTLEHATLKKIQSLYSRSLTKIVLSTGGGIVLRKENKVILNQIGLIYWLDAPINQLWNRVNKRLDKRPLLSSSQDAKATLLKIFDDRKDLYASFSDRQIDTSSSSFSKILDLF